MLEDNYVSFRIFHQQEQAEETKAILESNNVECFLKVHPPSFNAALGLTNDFEAELFVLEREKGKAKRILEEEAAKEIDDVVADHHLQELTNVELYEITYFKEEWNELDVQVAYKILEDRGVNDFEHLEGQMKKENPERFEESDQRQIKWLLAGYISALVFSLIGFAIGLYIYTKKNKLPEGKAIYRFNKKDRSHGLIIAVVAVCLFVWRVYSGVVFFFLEYFD